MKCPHCGRELRLFDEVLSLWQCPYDYVIFDSPVRNEEPDMTLAEMACPTGKCE